MIEIGFYCMAKSNEEIANEAIKRALRSLRKRHLSEEGAHASAFAALSRPIVSQVPFICFFRFFFCEFDLEFIFGYPCHNP